VKQRVVDGEFGAVKRLSLRAFWPRTRQYYERAAWAGRLLLNGKMVLDSCIGNATAHYVQNMLFWAGPTLDLPAEVSTVEAQLYRAHAIESFDTVFLRAAVGGARVPLSLVVSHACDGEGDDEEIVECESATIRVPRRSACDIAWQDGRSEKIELPTTGPSRMRDNYESLFSVLEGRASRPFTTLTDCRPFVALHSLAFVSSGGITTVEPPQSREYRTDTAAGVAIEGLREVGAEFLETGQFPDTARVPWAGSPPDPVTPDALAEFDEAWLGKLTVGATS
jgi:hypothetical protein